MEGLCLCTTAVRWVMWFCVTSTSEYNLVPVDFARIFIRSSEKVVFRESVAYCVCIYNAEHFCGFNVLLSCKLCICLLCAAVIWMTIYLNVNDANGTRHRQSLWYSVSAWNRSLCAGIPYRNLFLFLNFIVTHIKIYTIFIYLFQFFWRYILALLLRSIPVLLNFHFEHCIQWINNEETVVTEFKRVISVAFVYY
jgi:hypothetical protein